MTPSDPALPAIADALDRERAALLRDWLGRVERDGALDGRSEWTLRQLHDHFPDVLEAFGQRLRRLPDIATTAEADDQAHAEAHARTRWLQGYSLRAVIREWGHFNSAVVAVLGRLRGAAPALAPADAFMAAEQLWSRIVNDHLTESALVYHGLLQAEAQTRATELNGLLERVRLLDRERAWRLGGVAEALRNELSLVATSSVLIDDASAGDRDELRAMTRDGIAALDRTLSDLVLLARLEAGLEPRTVAPFDAGHGLSLLAASIRHEVESAGPALDWEGPVPFPVEGDERHLRLLARQLVRASLEAAGPGRLCLRWGDDPRKASRWVLELRYPARQDATAASPSIAREIAFATDRAQHASGIAPTGHEAALLDGRIAVATGDGLPLLIARHLCELLDAGLELDAPEGEVRYRISFPRSYAGDAPG